MTALPTADYTAEQLQRHLDYNAEQASELAQRMTGEERADLCYESRRGHLPAVAIAAIVYQARRRLDGERRARAEAQTNWQLIKRNGGDLTYHPRREAHSESPRRTFRDPCFRRLRNRQ